ncbi:MAG: thioredoxin [Bacillota bacterium]|jgi:thioredoxin 1
MTIITLTKDNFQQEALASKQPILIDFWAPWCGPCRKISPVLEELAKELSGEAKIGKVNVDEERELAAQFSVMSIPTLIVLKDGQQTASAIGVQSKEELLQLLKK